MSTIQAKFKLSRSEFALDIDLTLPSKGVTVFFGPSGSGKTTLLRCIAGLERVPNGFLSVKDQVWQDGKSNWLPTHQRPIGFVFQESSLFPHLNGLENLQYGLKRTTNKNVSLDQAIELLGIKHLLPRKSASLSGGERQRICIARALAVSPELLLMDEPLSALDHQRKKEILPFLERLHNELNIPIFYVTHSPEEVARLADYIVFLEKGTVVAHGELTETLSRIDLPYRMGEDYSVVFNAQICERDTKWNLTRLEFPGGSLWSYDRGNSIGTHIRVRIWARDVSIATEASHNTSIQNILAGKVVGFSNDTFPGLKLVQVQVGSTIIFARLSARAIANLDIVIGKNIWLQIKTVALLD
jgi:molybdate transport system ATP-binding protein